MPGVTVVFWALLVGELHRTETEHVPATGDTVTLPGQLGSGTVIQRDFASTLDGGTELMIQLELQSPTALNRRFRGRNR
ncbi:hypothetical protein ACI3KX_12975 [Microbacterium sp. ZW CA_36]|uniref:hypothetical protein n=1 Tax=Microbacterium sp. ZW CA_36 TaxID=3378078 RepID=UPI003854BC65